MLTDRLFTSDNSATDASASTSKLLALSEERRRRPLAPLRVLRSGKSYEPDLALHLALRNSDASASGGRPSADPLAVCPLLECGD